MHVSEFFSYIVHNKYNHSDLEIVISEFNNIISDNFNSITFRNLVIDEFEIIAKEDFEFYNRIVNLAVNNSLLCIEFLLIKSSILVLHNKSKGNIENYLVPKEHLGMNLLNKTLHMILIGEYTKEISISESAKKIFVGHNPSLLLPIKYWENKIDDVLELLSEKYMDKLLENDFQDDLDIFESIKKLNMIYEQMNIDGINVSSLAYSKSNCQELFPEKHNVDNTTYDELIFHNIGITFFPLVSDVSLEKKKLRFSNQGYGCLSQGNLSIIYDDECILNMDIEIPYNTTYDEIYLNNKLIKIITDGDPNTFLKFVLSFKKYDQLYSFPIVKKIGKLKESLSNNGENMNKISINNVNGDFTYIDNTKGTIINIVENKNYLQKEYEQLLASVDEQDINESDKTEIKTKIRKIIANLKSINEAGEDASSTLTNIKNLTSQVMQITKDANNTSKFVTVLNSIKEILGM